MQPGDTDGYGRHGILSIVHDDEGVRCHDCGLVRRTLGTHLRHAHGTTATAYRLAHGLPAGLALSAPRCDHRRFPAAGSGLPRVPATVRGTVPATAGG